jgi:phospholipase/carboxylesterase
VVALSAYLPLASALTAQRSRESVTLPIWMAHGSDDDTVPLALAESSRAHLHALGHHVTLSIYRMGHGVCPQELGALRERLCEWVA